eukprot:Selendium_serpulae@DN2782_c0_g1_i1.p2
MLDPERPSLSKDNDGSTVSTKATKGFDNTTQTDSGDNTAIHTAANAQTDLKGQLQRHFRLKDNCKDIFVNVCKDIDNDGSTDRVGATKGRPHEGVLESELQAALQAARESELQGVFEKYASELQGDLMRCESLLKATSAGNLEAVKRLH